MLLETLLLTVYDDTVPFKMHEVPFQYPFFGQVMHLPFQRKDEKGHVTGKAVCGLWIVSVCALAWEVLCKK